MSDLISRQAAIAEFGPYAEYESNMTNKDWVKRIKAVLEGMPSTQQWIPCSERQPEETNLYWVTIKVPNSEMSEVVQRWYFGRGYGDGWEAELYEPPLAWMPIKWPEPWKGEEDERL